MSNIVYLGTLILLACFMCKPCEAIVDVTCTNSDPSNCTTYGNAECNADKCGCKDNFYDNGTTCLSKVAINNTCVTEQSDDQCSDTNAVCTSGSQKCLCKTGYFLHSDGVCTIKVAINNTCVTGQSDDQCSDTNAVCTSGSKKCLCKAVYFLHSDGVCSKKVTINSECATGQSDDQCSDTNAECTSNQCLCKGGYFLDSNNICTIKVAINNACANGQPDNQCSDTHAECTSGSNTCLCKAEYFLASNNVCTIKVAITQVCTTGQPDDQCSDTNANCTSESGSFKCQCKADYFLASNNVCTIKKLPGGNCTVAGTTTECLDSMSDCSSEKKCRCKSGYYDNDLDDTNIGGSCAQKLESGVNCMEADSDECIQNSTCKSNGTIGLKCTCDTGYYDINFSATGGLCVPEKTPGEACSVTGQPTECVPNADCQNSKCTCTSDYYDSNGLSSGGTCEKKVLVNGVCMNGGQSDQCKDLKSTCTADSGSVNTYKCKCVANYYNNAETCTMTTAIGQPCSQGGASDQCSDPKSSCSSDGDEYRCLCNSGYYVFNDTCTARVVLEQICINGRPPNQCNDDNATCTSGSNEFRCQCKTGFYKNNANICAAKITINNNCVDGQPSDQCDDGDAACLSDSSTFKCSCKVGFYLNSGDKCTSKVVLNAICTSGQPDNQCVDTNAACQVETGTTYKCLCKNNFYKNNAGKCYEKSGLGIGCINGEPANQCSVTNTECIANSTGGNIFKCLCMAGYYSDSTCKALADLKANNLMIPAVTTGETYFLVTWSNPTTVSFINKYQLVLSFNGQQETLVEITTSKVNYNVTSRTPGRKYRIILRSIETASRPTQQTTEIEIMDGSRPSIPGLLQGSVFTAPSISFVWTTNGDVEFFSGTINDTTASPNTFNLTAINRIPPPLYVSKLRYGDHYTFTVVSHSNGFSSDSRTQTIRTTPTTPPPPVNLNCKEVFDRSLTITWNEPNPPNGYILHYIVYHISLNKELQTNGSVTEQLIEGLYPETWYSFQVATVNDASTGTSGRSAPKYCQTQTALASKPLNAVSTSVTTTSTTMEWDPPAEPGGQIWAYKLTVSNVTGGTETCVQEVIFQCSNCSVVAFSNECTKNISLSKTADEFGMTMNYSIEDLSPDVEYEVRIQAVNFKGPGNPADILRRTLQDAPQKPTQVTGTMNSDPTVLQVSWVQPLPRPGTTTYTVRVYEANDDNSDFVLKEKFGKVITGYYTQTATITGLEEYWDYKFMIVAKTPVGVMKSDMSQAVKTNYADPGRVENFDITTPQGNYTQMIVSWSIPLLRERNGIIKEYVLKHNISEVQTTANPILNTAKSLVYKLDVDTEKYYEIKLSAKNQWNQIGTEVVEVYYAPPGPPKKPPFTPTTTEVRKTVTTQRTIPVTLNGNWFFYNRDNGRFTDWGVIVCSGDACKNYGDGTEKSSDHFGIGNFKTWKEAQKIGFTEPYRATNSSWIIDIFDSQVGRSKRSTNDVELVIGEDNDCAKREDTVYCNGPLAPGKSYIIIVFSCTAGGCTESEQLGPYSTQPEPEDVPIAIIAGAAAAVVVFIILVIIIVVIKKKRNRNQPKKMEEEVEPDFTNPAGLETPSVERKNIKKKRPVKMIDFEAKIAELHKDSNLRFAHEYEELKTLTDPKTMKGVTTLLAETEDNKLKNRYVNILPYDHTIVKLLPLGDDDEEASTFINANYIPGYKSQREYIASQGPIPSTIDDFWRMVWEQSVSIIVMLTLAKEDGRIKCETYWPTEQSEAKQYGDIVVDMQSCSTINTYEFRIFKLTLGDKSRTLKHFHFLNWKDFSANVQNDVMVDFISNVRSHVTIPESRVPMIVHCSAGVGRTGTFIALDHMMQFIRDHDFNSVIDIFDLVVKMRECRMYMVQTEQQYIFIHDCIKDILEKKRQKELEDGEGLYGNVSNQNNQDNIYSNDAFEPDQDLYQNVDMAQPKTEL